MHSLIIFALRQGLLSATVFPAFRAVSAQLKAVLPRLSTGTQSQRQAALLVSCHTVIRFCDTDHGVWKLPAGSEYYRRCLRSHTTTDMTPDVRQLLLSEPQSRGVLI